MPSFPYNYRLEVKLPRHLHYARWEVAVGAIDKSELPTVKSGVRTCKSHAVKCVVHLPTKLETIALAKWEILAKRQIPVVNPWTERPSRILANVALFSLLSEDKVPGIEVM